MTPVTHHPHSPAALDAASIPVLREHLRSADPQLRADAACALGDRVRAREVESLDLEVREDLAQLLEDPQWPVRFEAAIALAELQDSRARDLLLYATRRRALRLDAVRALGSLGDTGAIPTLEAMLTGWLYPWADKLQAAAALCALGEAKGAAHLEARLTSRRRAERAAAIHFIGEARHPRARALLTDILRDPRDAMRDVAARTLGALRDPAAEGSLREALVAATGEFKEDILQALTQLQTR